MIDELFEFKKKHFDYFVIQAEYIYCLNYLNNGNEDKICSYMFNKFDPTQNQLDKLCQTPSPKIHSVLLNKNYNYTIDNYKNLKRYNYCQPINGDNFNNNNVFIWCQTIYKENKIFKIKFNNVIVDTTTINILFLYTKYDSFNTYTTEQMASYYNLYDAIFDNCNIDIWKLLNDKNIILDRTGILLPYITNKYGYNNTFTKSLINTQECNLILLFDAILNGYVVDSDDLNNMLCNRDKMRLLNYNDKYSKIGILQNFFDINGYIYTHKLYETFNVPMTFDTLMIAISHKNYELATIALENYNVMPNKDTLDLAIQNIYVYSIMEDEYNLICNILKYKIIPDNETLKKLNSYDSTECKIKYIELLMNSGLIIDYDTFEYLLSKRTPVKNLERFAILYDEKLYFSCYKCDTFCDEYYDKFTIDKQTLDLHKFCKSKIKDIDTFYGYFKKNNMMLDKYALDYLIFYNKKYADIIIEKYNLIPSILTLMKHINRKVDLDNIMKQYNLTHMHMFEKYDIKIEI